MIRISSRAVWDLGTSAYDADIQFRSGEGVTARLARMMFVSKVFPLKHRLAIAPAIALALVMAGEVRANGPGGAARSTSSVVSGAAVAGTYPVGVQFIHYRDPQRRSWDDTADRPLNGVIWFPAVAGARETPWEVADFRLGRVAQGAAPATPTDTPHIGTKLPLIVLSHGTGGIGAGLGWLGEALAAHGYVVAALNHHGSTGAEENPPLQGTLVWWDRPQDLKVLIDRLLADPTWGPRIDPERIGAAGFSIGGYTTLAVVGARLSGAQWKDKCDESPEACRLPPEISSRFTTDDVSRLKREDVRLRSALARMDDSYADPRIKAAFSMAPVMGAAMTRESLRAIRVPVEIVVGDRDDQADPAANARPMANAILGAKLVILPGVSHYTFLPVCNSRGQREVKLLCAEPEGLDRASIHRVVSDRALGFFDKHLSGK
ncbi:alpha/beta hydrolase family protein [Roseateles sp. NT4]|uniref:alpha/beta hydrolase family protein n=1 Tax=Roseateles sp. NT4 TaxID=3453715 RepID=UPI003EEC1D5C